MGQADFLPELFDLPASDSPPGDGLIRWREQRALMLQEQASELQIPIGHKVRIYFATGDPLEGLLEFAQERIFWDCKLNEPVDLRIGFSIFSCRDIKDWVRLD